jgi:hypothetical protein
MGRDVVSYRTSHPPVVLTKRIEDSKGQPSFNHACFIWDWKHNGAPMLAYEPCAEGSRQK